MANKDRDGVDRFVVIGSTILLSIIAIGSAFGGVVMWSDARFAPKETTERDLARIESKVDQIITILMEGKRGK